MSTNTNSCSCGCSETHVVATRQTWDSAPVTMWSDGAVEVQDGDVTRRVSVGTEVGWRVMEEVSCFEASEVPARVMRMSRVVSRERRRRGW